MHHEGAQLSVALYAHHQMVRRFMMYYVAATTSWLLLSMERRGSICIGMHTLIPESELGLTLERLELQLQEWRAAGHIVDVRSIIASRECRPEPT